MATHARAIKPTSDIIREARESRGWSHSDLASRCETTAATIRGIEDGQFEPRAELLTALGSVLSLDGATLNGRTVEPVQSVTNPTAARPAARNTTVPFVTLPAAELAHLRADLARARRDRDAAQHEVDTAHATLDRLGVAPAVRPGTGALAARIEALDVKAAEDAGMFWADVTCPNCRRSTGICGPRSVCTYIARPAYTGPVAADPFGGSWAGQGWGASANGGAL